MSWAKFDDRYHDNRKVKRAWRAHPRAVGLHAMAVTYCAMHETDGIVDPEWIEERLPQPRERADVLRALVDTGLFEPENDGTFMVHDYLVYNPEHADLEEKRRRDSERKRSKSPRGFHADSTRNPDGIQSDSAWPHAGAPAIASRPDPTRPDEGTSKDMPGPTRNGHESGQPK